MRVCSLPSFFHPPLSRWGFPGGQLRLDPSIGHALLRQMYESERIFGYIAMFGSFASLALSIGYGLSVYGLDIPLLVCLSDLRDTSIRTACTLYIAQFLFDALSCISELLNQWHESYVRTRTIRRRRPPDVLTYQN